MSGIAETIDRESGECPRLNWISYNRSHGES